MDPREREKRGDFHEDRPDLVVIDFRTRSRQLFKRVEIIGDLIHRSANKPVSGIHQPRFVDKLGRREWRDLLVTAAAIGLLAEMCSYLPPVP